MNNYEKSIQAIKDYDIKISAKVWNKIAENMDFYHQRVYAL